VVCQSLGSPPVGLKLKPDSVFCCSALEIKFNFLGLSFDREYYWQIL